MLQLLVGLLILAQDPAAIPTEIAERSFTWDPQGAVSFSACHQFDETDHESIKLMLKGDYARAGGLQYDRAREGGKGAFFSVWVIAESARVRKDLSGLQRLIEAYPIHERESPASLYARYREASLSFAFALAGGNETLPQEDMFALSSKLDQLFDKASRIAPDHLPLAIALSSAPFASCSEIRLMVDRAIEKNGSQPGLLLWKARIYSNCRPVTTTDQKTKQVVRLPNGDVDFSFREGDAPDIEGAMKALDEYSKISPNDPLIQFYTAKTLSTDALFLTPTMLIENGRWMKQLEQ